MAGLMVIKAIAMQLVEALPMLADSLGESFLELSIETGLCRVAPYI